MKINSIIIKKRSILLIKKYRKIKNMQEDNIRTFNLFRISKILNRLSIKLLEIRHY